jgi:PAS domain S-box-containing protein
MALKIKFQKDKILAMNPKVSLIILLVIAIALFGALLIWNYAETERENALRVWQVNMNLQADNQSREVIGWVERQYSALSMLADNASLQLYMTEIITNPEQATGEPLPEQGFLRNLLAVTAEKNGFSLTSENDDVSANIRRLGTSGLALLDNEGRVMVGTKGMPPIAGALMKFVKEVPKGSRGMLDIYLGAGGDATMAFSVPVFAIQGDKEASQQIGIVLGVRPVASVFEALKAADALAKSESVLVRINGNLVEYLSPQKDGTPPLSRRLDISTPDLDAAFAALRPDIFATKRDHQFNDVLVVGRKVGGTNWMLVHTIKLSDALVDSNKRRSRVIGVFSLILVVVIVSVVAAWRHGESVRYEEAAQRYKKLSEQYKSQELLLRLVSDNQPDPMYIVDDQNKYRFANMEAALRVGISPEDMIGKTLDSVLGPGKVKEYKVANKKALEMVESIVELHHVDNAVIQSKHVPVTRVPVHLSEGENAGVLVVEQDITEVMKEREKNERILNELVDTLVLIVDKHNPYAANHSARVARLARGVADEMKLDKKLKNATEVAGKLMNIGKVLVSTDLLVKKEMLREDELKSIRDSIYASADFLRGIEFEGPVVDTLLQSIECWDGSGPKAMMGEDILLSARIIAACNAFIGMLSPRAYRESLGREKAIEVLLGEIAKKFDRNVVVALINYVENHAKDATWLEAKGGTRA